MIETINNSVQEFIEKYKYFESIIRMKYDISPEVSFYSYMKKNRTQEFRKYGEELASLKEIRNFYQHKRRLGSKDWVIPSVEAICKLDEIIEFSKKRKRVMEIAISSDKIFSRRITDSVKPTMKEMREKLFTHVPIIDSGKVIGIFDENSIFGYLAENEVLLENDDDITFEEIKDYLNIEGREMETFLFVSRTTFVDDLEVEFEEAYKRDVRLGAIFVTATGNRNETVLGMITPWDILYGR